jgi:microcystin-dependent protein
MWSATTYTFSPSTTIMSSEVNQNFSDLVSDIDLAMPSSATGHGIIAFSGAIASIPSGWYLCNGSNGTPDLRDKFIVGAGSTYAVGATGGEATHTLTEAEMPVHTHIQTQHRHTLQLQGDGDAGSGSYTAESSDSSASSVYNTGYTTPVNQNAGSGTAHNNLPPYYALAFIMKA